MTEQEKQNKIEALYRAMEYANDIAALRAEIAELEAVES